MKESSCGSYMFFNVGDLFFMYLYLFFVLHCVQQPGSYCDGYFTGGGTSAY